MDARLRVLSGPHAGETFEVHRGKLLIGREEDCHVRPDSEFVSRHHCVLLLDDFTLRIRDLGSKNGTFVNGRRIGAGETILLHDDVISIGEMVCQIDLAPAGKEVDTGSSEGQPGALAMLHGTGIFDGDTVQAESSSFVPPSQTPPLGVTTPHSPQSAKPNPTADTETVQQPRP